MKKGDIFKGQISTSKIEHVYILLNDVECGIEIGKTNYLNFTSTPPPNFQTTLSLNPDTIPDYWFENKKEESFLGHDPEGLIYCIEIEAHESFGSFYEMPRLCEQICKVPELEILLNDEQNSCGC